MTAEITAGRWYTISEIMRMGVIPGCRNTIKKLIHSGELHGEQLTSGGWYRVHESSLNQFLDKRRGKDSALHRVSDAAPQDFTASGSVWQRPAVQAVFEGGPVQDHLTRRDGPRPSFPAASVRPGAQETHRAGQGEPSSAA